MLHVDFSHDCFKAFKLLVHLLLKVHKSLIVSFLLLFLLSGSLEEFVLVIFVHLVELVTIVPLHFGLGSLEVLVLLLVCGTLLVDLLLEFLLLAVILLS